MLKHLSFPSVLEAFCYFGNSSCLGTPEAEITMLLGSMVHWVILGILSYLQISALSIVLGFFGPIFVWICICVYVHASILKRIIGNWLKPLWGQENVNVLGRLGDEPLLCSCHVLNTVLFSEARVCMNGVHCCPSIVQVARQAQHHIFSSIIVDGIKIW